MRWTRVLLASSVLLVCFSPSAALAADDADIASGDVTLHPAVGDFKRLVPGSDAEYSAVDATVLLRNPTKASVTARVEAFLDDDKTLVIRSIKGPNIDIEATSVGGGPEQLPNDGQFVLPSGLTSVKITFVHLTRSDSTKGTLVLTGPGVLAASVVKLTIERPTPVWYIWTPLGAGLVLAFIIVGIRWFTLTTKKRDLGATVKWSFNDGWASNVVVVGAIVTAILGAVSSLGPDPFGDFALAKFVGLNLVFGGFVVIAPLIYAALRSSRTHPTNGTSVVGTVHGFLLAATVTLWAAFGQLIAVFILVRAATHQPGELLALGLLLGAAAIFVAVYAWNTIVWTVDNVTNVADPTITTLI
jgi:hypothetical protein